MAPDLYWLNSNNRWDGPMECAHIEFHPDLSIDGLKFIPSTELIRDLGTNIFDLKIFQDFWNWLPTDQRRFGVFHYVPGRGLTFEGNEKLFQFQCIELEFANDPVLKALLNQNIYRLPQHVRTKQLKVYVHQIRILPGDAISEDALLLISEALDTLMVNDHCVFHNVKPILATDAVGYRDLLKVEINYL